MNPSFAPSMAALMKSISNAMKGIEHTPKKKHETSINGRAFAPGKGVQQEPWSPEKEDRVRAHLNQLAAEAKARSIYPRSDMVEASEEEAST